MENSEAKRKLHECILEYMIENKMNHTAVMFAKEANVRLDVPMTGEGLLEKLWNIFFRDIYLRRLQTNPEAMEVSSSKFSTNILHQKATDQNAGNRSQNIRPESPRLMNHMLQNTSHTMEMPGIQNSFPNACQENLLTMGKPGIQSSFPNACQATQNRGNLSEDVLQQLSWRDMSYLLQNPTKAMIGGMPELYNHPQTVHSTAIPRPTMVDFRQRALPTRTPPSQNLLQSAQPMMTTPMANLPQSALPTTAQGQELDPNHLGSRSSLDSNAGNLTAESRQGLEHPRSRDSRGKTRFFTPK